MLLYISLEIIYRKKSEGRGRLFPKMQHLVYIMTRQFTYLHIVQYGRDSGRVTRIVRIFSAIIISKRTLICIAVLQCVRACQCLQPVGQLMDTA